MELVGLWLITRHSFLLWPLDHPVSGRVCAAAATHGLSSTHRSYLAFVQRLHLTRTLAHCEGPHPVFAIFCVGKQFLGTTSELSTLQPGPCVRASGLLVEALRYAAL